MKYRQKPTSKVDGESPWGLNPKNYSQLQNALSICIVPQGRAQFAIQYQMVSPQNIQTNNITQMEQVIFMNLYV